MFSIVAENFPIAKPEVTGRAKQDKF